MVDCPMEALDWSTGETSVLVKPRRSPNKTRIAEPKFFLIGAEKSGTTSLYHYLRQHPQLLLSVPKEPHYFSFQLDRHVDQEPGAASDYLALFETSRDEVIGGECSTSYLWHPHAAERLKRYQSDARIVAILRHPIERAWSHYRMNRRIALEATMEELLHEDHEWVTHGRYEAQVRTWLEHFPAEQIHVEYTDSLKADPRGVLRRICRHIGINPDAVDSIDTSIRYNRYRPAQRPGLARLARSPALIGLARAVLPRNARRWLRGVMLEEKPAPCMHPQTRELLQDWFRPTIVGLQRLASEGVVPPVPSRWHQ